MKTTKTQSLSLSDKRPIPSLLRKISDHLNTLRQLFLLSLCMLLTFSLKAQLNGKYTIDPSKSATKLNYKDFHSAVSDLDSGKRYDGGTVNGKGVSGSVVFTVAKDIYHEQIEITAITGASASSTVAFISASSDSTQAVLTYSSSSSASDYTLSLNGASYVTFQKMTISRLLNGTNAIIIRNGSTHNSFNHNLIIGNTSGYFIVQFRNSVSSVFNSYNLFDGNHIKSGKWAIYTTTAGNMDSFNTFKNNIIDSVQDGIAIDAQWGLNFSNNFYSDYDTNLSDIASFRDCGKASIFSNHFLFIISGAVVFADFTGSATVRSNIYNNSIIVSDQNPGNTIPLHLEQANYVNFYFNSLSYTGVDNNTTGFGIINIADANKTNSLNFVNNNIYFTNTNPVSTTGNLIYSADANSINTLDYNNYYNNGYAFKGKYNSSMNITFSGWQTSTGFDKNSITTDPAFYNKRKNLRITNKNMVAGTALSGISKDLINRPRASIPSIGAYEYEAPTVLKAGFKYTFTRANCTDSFAMVTFTDTSISSNPSDSMSWFWDPGNGKYSTNQKVTFVFNKEGAYKIKLKIKTLSGVSDSVEKTVNIYLVPSFDIQLQNICDTLTTVSFKDTVYAGYGASIASYSWDFGDGNSSSLSNPTHTYTAGKGSYTIKSTITTYGGCSKTISMTIYPAIIKPTVTATVKSCGVVSFSNNSVTDINHNYNRVWDYGDNNFSYGNGGVYKYRLGGTYHYSLKISTNGCSKTFYDSVKVAQYVFIGGFFKAINTCSPDSVIFLDSSISKYGTSPYSYGIAFGDSVFSFGLSSIPSVYSHKYPGPGTYYVRHFITDKNGCSNLYQQKITITQDLKAIFNYQNTCKGIVIFTDKSEGYTGNISGWHWDFGDGDTSVIQNPQHSYKKDGTYNVKLTVKNSTCTDIITNKIFVNTIFKPSITAVSLSCLADSIILAGKELNNLTGLYYWWTIPGEKIDSLKNGKSNLTFKFAHGGYKKILLRIGNTAGCSDTVSTTIFIDSACVWPGDADYNKKVNIKDILPIGIAYGLTGTTRPNASINWNAQPAYDWSKTFKAGNNYKHADCNGDGVVDTADLKAITKNFGKTHPKTEQIASGNPNDPPLSIVFNKDSAAAGDTVVAMINLGSSLINAKNIYGITVSLSYKSKNIPKLILTDFSKCWLGTLNNNLFALTHYDSAGNSIDVGLSRTDHKSVSGFGQIGTVSIVMTDNLAGKREVTDLFHLYISDYKAIDDIETDIPLNPISDSILVYQYKNGIQENNPVNYEMVIFPNPAKEYLHVAMNHSKIKNIVIEDMTGKCMYRQTVNGKSDADIVTSDLSKGLYIINIITDQGSYAARFVKD
jgi:PKD repeat protein